MKVKSWALVAFALALTSSPLAVQQQSGTARIEGRILDALTGNPISDAGVTLAVYVTPDDRPLPGFQAIFPAARDPITTSPDGTFRIDGVRAGDYRVVAMARGYVRQEYMQKLTYGSGRPIRLSDGQSLQGIDIRLVRTGSLSGRVVDDSGKPAVDAPVNLLHPRPSDQGLVLDRILNTKVNDRGEYLFTGVSPGRYYVSVGSTPGFTRPQLLYARGPNQAPIIDYGLSFFPGTPLLAQAAQIEIRPTEEASASMSVMRQRPYRIRGKIIVNGDPPPMVQVSLLPDPPVISLGDIIIDNRGVRPDAKTGEFEVQSVLPGSYTLRAQVAPTPQRGAGPVVQRGAGPVVQEGPSQAQSAPMAGQTSIRVVDRDIEGVFVTLTPSATISGRVTVEGESLDLSKMNINLWLVPLHPNLPLPDPQRLALAADGSFNIRSIRSGEYRLQLRRLDASLYTKSISLGSTDLLEKPLIVAGASSETLQIVLRRGAARVTGVVRDDRLQPVPGIKVTIVRSDRGKAEDKDRLVVSDSTGRFVIAGIPPGEYRIYAWEDLEDGAYFDPEFLKRYEVEGKSLMVAESSQNTVELKPLAIK